MQKTSGYYIETITITLHLCIVANSILLVDSCINKVLLRHYIE